jgi:UDP-glucose 4-epimerase
MPVCLVTGGAGFIGSRLVHTLVARQHTVRVLDNLSTGSLANLGAHVNRVQFLLGDLADLDFVRHATAGAELVFHQATPAYAPGAQLPDPHNCAATRGTLHVLIAARETGVRRVIYASGSAVYGKARPRPVGEDSPATPLSGYALAKLAGEDHCLAFTKLYGLETVRLRYFNVFGPRQPAYSPNARLLLDIKMAMLAGRHPVIPNLEFRGQDYIYIDDVVHANLLAAETPRLTGKAYNVGSGRLRTPLEVVETINEILGTRIPATLNGPGPTEEFQNVADITRAEVDLGFCPSTDFAAGLQQWIDYQCALTPGRVDPPGSPLGPRHRAPLPRVRASQHKPEGPS